MKSTSSMLLLLRRLQKTGTSLCTKSSRKDFSLDITRAKSLVKYRALTTRAKSLVQDRSLTSRFTTSAFILNENKMDENKMDEIKERIRPSAIDHFKKRDYSLPHRIWTEEEVDAINVTHRYPNGFSDNLAYGCVQILRKTFDILSGYTIGYRLKTLDERAVLNRCIFLETIAGVPGFSAAMIRHLNSLRRMELDHGWIHTLLEEAENERMHLMTFTQLRRPGIFFRGMVIFSQYIFTGAFSVTYLISPNFCHRFVGYLEEQAVITYTHILEEIDAGRLPMMEQLRAPPVAIDYWKLGNEAMMRDVFLAVRADEAHHRDVNHTLGSMDKCDNNPFPPGH